MIILNDKAYGFIGSFVVLATIFLWPIEFGPEGYDVGVHVFISFLAFGIYFPYIIKKFDAFPFVFSSIIIVYQLLWAGLNGFDARSILTCVCFVFYFYAIFYSVFFCFKDVFSIFRDLLIPFLTAQLCLQALQVFEVFTLHEYFTSRQYIFGTIGGTGFYGEGSHVGLSLVPLMFLKDNQGKHLNLHSILVVFSLLLGISSTSILGAVVLFFLLIFKINSWRRICIALAAIIVLMTVTIIGAQVFHITTFSRLLERLWGVVQVLGGKIEPGVNLSVLVYANGVDMAWSGLKDIIGSGIGHFNIYYADSIARIAIDQVAHGQLNKDDGSVVFLKMIGEMGLFGLAIVVYFVFNSLSIIKKYGDSTLSVIACFVIMAGIRSAGYFHGPYILSFAVVGVLWQLRGTCPNGMINQQTDAIPHPVENSPSDR